MLACGVVTFMRKIQTKKHVLMLQNAVDDFQQMLLSSTLEHNGSETVSVWEGREGGG